jgi:hypothetical protein
VRHHPHCADDSIRLASSSLGAHAAIVLCKALARRAADRVRVIDVSHNPLGDAGVQVCVCFAALFY